MHDDQSSIGCLCCSLKSIAKRPVLSSKEAILAQTAAHIFKAFVSYLDLHYPQSGTIFSKHKKLSG